MSTFSIFPNIEEVKTVAIDGKINVIIGFKNKPGSSDKDFITGLGGTIDRVYTVINAIATTVPEKAIETIKKSPNVEYVEIDEKMYAHGNVPIGTCQEIKILKQMIPWGVGRIGATLVHTMGNTGKGIKIAILDTGMDSSHEDLNRNYKGGYNFVDNNTDVSDQNGHGCCHPDTMLFTTLCGLNRIEDFYNRIDSQEILNDDGSKTKILCDDIYTLSICSNNMKVGIQKQRTLDFCFELNSEDDKKIRNSLEKRKIKSVHKIHIKDDKLVQINDIILTPWHKCFVFDRDRLQIEEKRADNIALGDYLIAPGRSLDLNEYRKDKIIGLIDEDLSYLLGVVTGNGSVILDNKNKRIDLSLSSIDVANKCTYICNRLGYKITTPIWQNKNHYYRTIIYNENLVRFCYHNIKTLSTNARIPEIIVKSPFDVLMSFISGLIDTDGNIKEGGTRIRISSSSKEGIIDRLYNILSVIGLQPGIVKIQDSPHFVNGYLIACTVPNYQIIFHIDTIGEILLKYIACKEKKDLLKIQLNKNNSIPISERKLRKYLTKQYGLKFDSNHRCICCGKVMLKLADTGVSKKKLKESLEVHNRGDDYLYSIAKDFNFVEVKSISRLSYEGNFYDMTIEDSNNYVAGLTDMVFIHNTHVAGIIAATDNDIGVVGVAPDAHLYSVRVLNYDSTGTASDITAGLEWCLLNNIQIVNMSLGACEESISVRRTCDILYNRGILLIAAAGNNGNAKGAGDNIDNPAKYESIVAVGATDINDSRASFSSTGSKLELAAPGNEIYSTLPGNKYGSLSGTSMACPHVTGVAALIKGAYPEMTNVQTRIRMQISAQNIAKNGFRAKDWFGYGLIDAVKAVSI